MVGAAGGKCCLPPIPIYRVDSRANTQQNIKSGITGHAASWYSDVFDLVFPHVDAQQVNGMWKTQLAKSKKEKGETDGEDELDGELEGAVNGAIPS